MERERFIRVPKDAKAMEDYDCGVQKNDQIEEMILTEQQYKILNDMELFDKINDKCDVIIDDFEEEVIELDKIPLALEVVVQLSKNNSSAELLEVKKMFELALNFKTIIGFDF